MSLDDESVYHWRCGTSHRLPDHIYCPGDIPEGWNGTKESDLDHVKESPSGWASDYYVLPEGAKELGDLIEYRDMNFNVGNIFKAAYRLGEKDGTSIEYDLNKIIYFAKRELKRRGSNPDVDS